MAELVFDCIGARVDRYAAVPSFGLDLRISETSGEKVDAIALRVQIRIEPFRRPYSDDEAERLHDLFGERVRWADTLKPLQFTTISTMVPGFTGSIEIELPVPFTYDLQIASTRYFSSLDDGEIPLLLLFSGTIFGSADGRMRVQQVPWSKETTFRLPVSQWREAVDAHFPDTAWITMTRKTLDELGRFKSRHALPDLGRHRAGAARPDRPGGIVKSRDRIDPAHLEQARQVADAILYEGYLLYPYRASAQKNQERFQFGVLMPAAYRAVDEHEPSAAQTECVLDGPADSAVTVLARFLQVQRRTVLAGSPDAGFREVGSLEAGGVEHTPWDEAAECEQEAAATLGELLDGGTETEFTVPGATEHEDLPGPGGTQAGRLVRQRETLHAVIRMSAERLPGPYGAIRLHVVLENRTEPPGPLGRRSDGLPYALIAAHCLIAAPGGRFLSMTDPPEWAAAEVGRCVNTGTWPVLAGPPDCTELMLSSPVILYDHAEIAAESAGPLFDSTEIDEILTLRTLTLTDDEKRAARATDPRAADLLDRLDHLPARDDRAHARCHPVPQSSRRASRECCRGARHGAGVDRTPAGAARGLRGTGTAGARGGPWRSGRRRPGALVGSGRGQLGVAGNGSRHDHRGPRGPGQPGPDAAGRPPGGCPGPVPGRADRAGRGGAVRRGRSRPPGAAARRRPGRRHPPRPGPLPVLRP